MAIHIRARSRRRSRWPALAAALLTVLALAAPAYAAGGDPLGFEATDGNQIVDGVGPGFSDWQNIGALTGTLQHVSDATGAGDDIYGAGSENAPDSWTFQTGSASGKTDILNFWADSHQPIATAHFSPSAFLYLAFERGPDTTPSTADEFEVNQSAARWTNSAGASVPCRTDGDLL